MDVTTVQPPVAVKDTGLSTTADSIVSDYETFLTLLTTQIQFQDPLNPADSTEFVAQLATFSSVEQQIQTNTLLESLTELTGVQGLGELASWVGMEVQSSAPIKYRGEPITLYPEIPNIADRAELIIADPSGQEVGRLNIDPRQTALNWTGQTNTGQTLASGTYAFTVEPFAGDTPMTPAQVTAYQKVSEARLSNGAPVLGLEGGGQLQANQVLSLRPVDNSP